jgi:hypothetical protein
LVGKTVGRNRSGLAHTRPMELDVNRLRRRSPGPRVLVQLDQSTLSELALADAHAATRELLIAGAQAGKLVCPKSLGATDETLDLPELWQAIFDLHEELSMGIEFLDPKTIRQREVFAAAAAFCRQERLYTTAEEAFDTDPQTPRNQLFPGGIRVIAGLAPMDVRRDEVAREKAKERTLQLAYDQARALGRTFEEQAAEEMEAMVRWVLGPPADPGFEAGLARKRLAATRALQVGDYGPISKLTAVGEREALAEALVQNFPALSTRPKEFAKSDELMDMPALRYQALLRAGLATMPRRVAQRGDGYDIDHLASGLSRCDIVTADAGMWQLVQNHKLVPAACRIFPTRDMASLHRAVEASLSSAC